MKLLCLTGCLGLSLQAALGQVSPPPAAVADTAGYDKSGYGILSDRLYFGTLTYQDGTQIQAYLPATRPGYVRRIDYHLTPCVRNEWSGRHKVKLKKIKSMAVHGRVYETVLAEDENDPVLALRLLEGPVQLFAYSEPRSLLLPIPLGVGLPMPVVGIPLHDKIHWYLRRNGVCTAMHRGSFAQAMSAYLFDNPDMASKVSAKAPSYQFLDTPAIIAEYNRAKVASTGQ